MRKGILAVYAGFVARLGAFIFALTVYRLWLVF